MVKRRKEVEVIVIDTEMSEKEQNKPLCLGEKEPYCRADFCGQEWYEQCSSD